MRPTFAPAAFLNGLLIAPNAPARCPPRCGSAQSSPNAPSLIVMVFIFEKSTATGIFSLMIIN